MQDNKINVSEKESELIKRIFKGNDYLLKAIRGLLFGLEISDEDKNLIKDTFSSPELLEIFSRRLLPQLNKDAPIGQVQDIWLGAETMIFGQSRDAIYQAAAYKNEAIKMTRRALELLVNPFDEGIDLSFKPELNISDPLQINLLARNQYIRHIEQQLYFIYLIAEQTDNKDSEKKAKLDSLE